MNEEIFANMRDPNDECPYGFIGRKNDLNDIISLFQHSMPVIVIYGKTGIGKTTILRKLINNFYDKDSSYEILWFSFTEIKSLEYFMNSIGANVYNPEFCKLTLNEQIPMIAHLFRENKYLIICDNFEAISTQTNDNEFFLSEDDREVLIEFINLINGGNSKILVASSNNEDWLGKENVCQFYLRGLAADDRWELCRSFFSHQGLDISLNDPGLVQLINILDGHPIAMRIILPLIEGRSIDSILIEYQENLSSINEFFQSENNDIKTYAALQFLINNLSDEIKEYLIPLAFFQNTVEIDLLESVASIRFSDIEMYVEDEIIDKGIQHLVEVLSWNGLIKKFIPGTENYQIHNIFSNYLNDYLLKTIDEDKYDLWAEVFVFIIGKMSSNISELENPGKRLWFHFNKTFFQNALNIAKKNGMIFESENILLTLIEFATICKNYLEAEDLLIDLAICQHQKESFKDIGKTYYQLGRTVQETKNYEKAEDWYKKALDIFEEYDENEGKANTQHQLGLIAQNSGNYKIAEKWYNKAIDNFEITGNLYGTATTCSQLGKITQEKNDYKNAQKLFNRSLQIFEMFEDEYGAAKIYNELGLIARKQFDLAGAKEWYEKAQLTFEKFGKEKDLLKTYHQFGLIAQDQRDFKTAKKHYDKTIELCKKLGNEDSLAEAYLQSGMIAQEQKDYYNAIQLYIKSLKINEKYDDHKGIAMTTCQLGMLSGFIGNFEDAGKFSIKSLISYYKCDSKDGVEQNINNFIINYKQAGIDSKKKLRNMWEKLIGELPISIQKIKQIEN